MRARTKNVKGRIKQAVGSLTGNKRLQRDGIADRRLGAASGRLTTAKGKVNMMLDRAANAVKVATSPIARRRRQG